MVFFFAGGGGGGGGGGHYLVGSPNASCGCRELMYYKGALVL